jgi:hypothetical protein
MGMQRILRSVLIMLIVLAALTLPPPASSQGCALCYTQAANSGTRMIRALRNGIVILAFPPLLMCLGAMVLTYRKRNEFNQSDSHVKPGSDW